MKSFLCLLVLLIFLPIQVFSWGHLGHRVVGEIAQKKLSKKAQAKVQSILGAESLAMASTWADEIRSDKNVRIEIGKRWPTSKTAGETDSHKLAGFVNSWHYTSVANKHQEYQPSSQAETGDIVYGMQKSIAILKNKKAPIQHQREALRLLAHFIGDVHQPHHVGSGLDRGGNLCWVNWFGDKYGKNISSRPAKKNEFVNLHKVWDEKLLGSRELSFTEYSERLLVPQPRILSMDKTETTELRKLGPVALANKFSEKQKEWQADSLLTWVKESRALRDQAYPGKPGKDGLYPYCFKSYKDTVDASQIPNISWDERYNMLRIAEIRVLQAGLRLAATLNDIFD